MKTHISKTILTIIGLLAAGTIANAQDSLAMPKATGPNLYVEAGAGYMLDSIKADDGSKPPSSLNNFYGATVAFGWRFLKEQKAQIETGVYASSAKYSDGSKDDVTVVPLLVSYSYCIPLGQDGSNEVRITPVAGILSVKYKFTDSGYSDSYSDTPFAYGIGAGFTHHFSKLIYLDAGYRLLGRGAVKGSDSGYNFTIAKSSIMHCLNVSVGFKF